MNQTTETQAVSAIDAALAQFQTKLPRITKDNIAKVKSERTGVQYSYSYADLAQVSAEVLPLLGAVGLAFTSRPTVTGDGRFALVYELRHVSGERIEGVYPLPSPERETPQAIGGHITYARRYCLLAVTGVAPEEDDDDAAAAERAAKRRDRRDSRQPQGAPGAAAKPQGDPISADQQRQMQSLFGAVGIADRQEKVTYAVRVVKRNLKTASELTRVEADAVIGALQLDVEKRTAKAATAEQQLVESDSNDWPETVRPPDGAQ